MFFQAIRNEEWFGYLEAITHALIIAAIAAVWTLSGETSAIVASIVIVGAMIIEFVAFSKATDDTKWQTYSRSWLHFMNVLALLFLWMPWLKPEGNELIYLKWSVTVALVTDLCFGIVGFISVEAENKWKNYGFAFLHILNFVAFLSFLVGLEYSNLLSGWVAATNLVVWLAVFVKNKGENDE